MALARLQRQKDAEEKKKRELQFKILRAGDAIYFPKSYDSLAIHYIGYLADGTMFDNSYNRGQPIYFILGGGHIIPGLEQVMPMMSKGQKARVTIPHHLAYGDRGFPPVIPPLATLTYEIELLTFTSSTHTNITERHQKGKLPEESKTYSPKKKKA